MVRVLTNCLCQKGALSYTNKTGKTLTINPKLLEKMQHDPETEKEMKELINGIETATRLVDGLCKGMGRKERWENSEKLIEKQKAAEAYQGRGRIV